MVTRTVYFGYGSNLWRAQMALRCPESRFLGRARLPGYRWLINDRGYANVVEIHSKDKGPDYLRQYEDEVWGLVYSLSVEDERKLDINEGVPVSYGKEFLSVEFWKDEANDEAQTGANSDPAPEHVDMLVYIDRERLAEDQPKKEYVYRMNMGIADAVRYGVPEEYVRKVLRRFIPDVEDKAIEGFAKKQALNFEDEN